MIVKSDQDHVRALLTEAVTVLCKKRLSFKSQLSVEGLIGITLDTDDIFLVSIKELILQSEESAADVEVAEPPMSTPVTLSSSSDSCSNNGGKVPRAGRQRKSTPRHLSVVSPPPYYSTENPHEDEEEEECDWLLQDGTDIDNLSPVAHLPSCTHDGSFTATTTTGTTPGVNSSDDSGIGKGVPNGFQENGLQENGLQENGIDAPLNLSNPSSHQHPNNRLNVKVEDKALHRDITPQKRKRHDSGDTDSQCSSISGSIKRPSSVSISSLSPARTTPTLELVSIKQEPNQDTPYNNNHHYDTATNGYLFIQPPRHDKTDMVSKTYGNWVMRDTTANILNGRTNLFDGAIMQRLASPITPLQLGSPLTPSQEVTKLVENGEMQEKGNDSSAPVLKVPLYSITGKLKKENKPAAPEKTITEKVVAEKTVTEKMVPERMFPDKMFLEKMFPEKMPIREAINMSNTPDRLIIKENGNNNTPDLDFEKRQIMKKLEGKVFPKSSTESGDSMDKFDHSYADVGLSGSDSVLDHSDGFHSFHTDSTDQENIEVFSVDSDDDAKTEDFIDRSQEPGKAVSYRCKLCDRVYSNKWNCRRHIQFTHMNKTGFTCEICKNKYRDRSDYQEHLQVIHKGPGGYKCEFCDKILMSKRSLKEHVSLHTGQYRYHCIECSRGFNRLNDYQLHMTKDHGASLSSVTGPEMAHIFGENAQNDFHQLHKVKDHPANLSSVSSAVVAQLFGDNVQKEGMEIEEVKSPEDLSRVA